MSCKGNPTRLRLIESRRQPERVASALTMQLGWGNYIIWSWLVTVGYFVPVEDVLDVLSISLDC